MARLYPPIIESTISACYEENGMVKFTIPFSMNRSVSEIQVGGFELKIKTVQTGSYLYTVSTFNPVNYKMTANESYVIFYLNDSEHKLKIGQYYKIQLAYIAIDNEIKSAETSSYENGNITLEQYEKNLLAQSIVGYYSDASVIKYTTKPKIYINNFSSGIINNYTHDFIGYYDQTNGDVTERVYSYYFNIYDKNKNLYYTSGECLHNSTLDNNIEITTDNFTLMADLTFYDIYYIQYTVTTSNKMVLSSPMYRIIQRATIEPEIQATLNAMLNFNNGYISIDLTPIKNNFVERAWEIIKEENSFKWLDTISNIQSYGFTLEEATLLHINRNKIDSNFKIDKYYLCTGAFVLSRASEDSNFSNWEEIYRFKFNQEIPEGKLYTDFDIIQGKNYQYSIQQYNDNNLYSERIYSNQIIADFEDSFLYDGQYQLKIKYNPKMSKFTNTVLESKQDTLGSQYPFIFRNGYVDYHEFPISGLISFLSDEEYLFMSKKELDILDEPHRHYTSKDKEKIIQQQKKVDDLENTLGKNITRERLFKTKVLDWLNNGKPKLFRSPTEGNYIVRLMKISLAPENKLGRMLHTFNATAYEIAEYNIQNLFSLNILKEPKEVAMKVFNSKTVDLSQYSPGRLLNVASNASVLIESLHFEDMFFGDTILITYNDNSQETIKIGLTGNYIVKQVAPIKNIMVLPRYRQALYVDSESIQNYYVRDMEGNYNKVPEDDTYNQYTTYYEISNNPLKGLLTYNYFATKDNQFSLVENVIYNPTSFQQFIGKHNILDEILDIKTEIVDLYQIKIEKRPIDRLFVGSENSTDEYFYGLPHSESTPMIELEYPIGLRPYVPGKYFIKQTDGSMVKDLQNSVYSKDAEYFIQGKYKLCNGNTIIGTNPFMLGEFYIKTNDNKYELASSFDHKETYYLKNYNPETNITSYSEIPYVCANNYYIYEPGKFYIVTDKINTSENIYTIAYEDFNPTRQYWDLVNDNDEYVPAYVTINQDYVYDSNKYYIRIEKPNKDNIDVKYYQATSSEFNMRNIKLAQDIYGQYLEDAEYASDFNGDTLKYYKMKPILPHIIHEIGYQSDLIDTTNQLTEVVVERENEEDLSFTRYLKFNRIHYRDFYNNKYYDQYEPWVIINDEQISVNDTIILNRSQLSNLSIYNFETGNGVIVDVVYQTRTIDYNIEKKLSEKEEYKKAISDYEDIKEVLLTKTPQGNYIYDLSRPASIDGSIYNKIYNNTYQTEINNTYDKLIQSIDAYINSKEEDNK